MRVTKTVKEYIQKNVRERLMPRYEADKALATANKEKLNAFTEGCRKAGMDAFNAYFNEHFHEIADFAEDNRKDGYSRVYFNNVSSCVFIPNERHSDSIYCWYSRLEHETNEKVDEIVVELELGGNKADLERLLAEI